MSLLIAMTVAASQAGIDYRRDETWLCRPGRQDACAGDLATTIVTPDGAMRPAPAERARPRDVDCFYVYPTVSLDPGANSDMLAGPEERGMTQAQFAPFRRVCRTFAPLYRQVTLTALRAVLRGGGERPDFELAYADVLAAWREYLAHDNGGRPFVLVGHSQGSLLLKRLVAQEIDGKPIQRRMLSAILPGTAVLVPVGRDVGGDFKRVRLCRRAVQTGCVVTWASYRDMAPPPPNALFGGSKVPGMAAGCTNPARLAGGKAPLATLLGAPWWRGGVAHYEQPVAGWTARGQRVPTRLVSTPGLLSARCVVAGSFRYLAVHVARGAAGDLTGALVGPDAIGDVAYPDWGFHVVDLNIVTGDLLRLIARQRAAYLGHAPARAIRTSSAPGRRMSSGEHR